MEPKAKCPKCGEIEQVEITKTWGSQLAMALDKNPFGFIYADSTPKIKQEIYCNTCGQISIIDVDTSSHTDEAKSTQE